MSESKAAIFILLGVLVLMTGVFTAFSADSGGFPMAVGAGEDEYVRVNGETISEEEFTSRVATVEQNMVMLSSQAESLPEDDPFVTSLLEIMDTTPPETIALASLILDTAVYQEALDRGHEPDAQVIRAQIEQERELFEMIEEDPEEYGADEESVANYRANIEEIGEETYWTEHYPKIIEKQTAVQEFQEAVDQSEEDWTALQQDIFRDADVEITDTDGVAPATIENAEAYMDAIWDLSENIPTDSLN